MNSTADTPMNELPIVVIGAGPVGLATAAHLLERELTPLVLEAGPSIGAAIRQWGHTGLFSPWRYNIDNAARRLLEPTGWQEPDLEALPTGHELLDEYLIPLATALDSVGSIDAGESDAGGGSASGNDTVGGDAQSVIRTDSRVVAVSREGIDKTRSADRENTPFLVRIESADGSIADVRARSVIDASGTWEQPNPLGRSGLPAPGETKAIEQGLITAPLPAVAGADRGRFAGRHTLVVGAGHSAANSLLDLVDLAAQEPRTRISWAVRTADLSGVYGGEDRDELAARGALGSRLRAAVDTGVIEVHTSFTITGFESNAEFTGTGSTDAESTNAAALTVHGSTPDGPTELTVDLLVPATGFRPNLAMLSELRLALDPAVDAPHQLGPLIDPEFHSCGSVEPHGEKLLAHPEPGFYIVGMKSYGRAPTFLMATGYEQVRSIAAALAGDREAADDVQLDLPETGVCSSDLGGSCGTTAPDAAASDSCCAPSTNADGSDNTAAAPAAGSDDSCCGAPIPQLITLGTSTSSSCC